MDNLNNKSITLPPKTPEKLIEEQRLHDILLLLQNLSYREEITIKLIIDCLYDIGANNIINQKFHSYFMNGTFKRIAKFSKPVFRMIAWRWFKKNFAQLTTNWLYEQVKFNQVTTPQPAPKVVVEQVQIQKDLPATLADKNREVKYLRSQVRFLVTIFILAITSFGGSFLWLNYKLEQAHLQTLQELQTQFRIKPTSVNNP